MSTEHFIAGKDASLGGEYPVMNVTLLHPGEQGCFSGFGAPPRCAAALERALSELRQGRARGARAGFPEPEPGLDLDDEACADLPDARNELNLADRRPVAADGGSIREDLRIGEPETLLAPAVGDAATVREGGAMHRRRLAASAKLHPPTA